MQDDKALDYKTIENVVDAMYTYLKKGDNTYIKQYQEEINILRGIDSGINTYAEYGGQDFDNHTPTRAIIFLINYFGEMYLENAKITIYDDEPNNRFYNSHENTYILKLKDPESHVKLGGYNPTKKDKPYDFDTEFKKQITHYKDSGKIDDTTLHPWNGFNRSKKKGYNTPIRTIDFKSAFYTSGKHTHDCDYIIKLTRDKQFLLYNMRANQVKSNLDSVPCTNCVIEINSDKDYLNKYLYYVNMIDEYNRCWSDKNNWKYFIIEGD